MEDVIFVSYARTDGDFALKLAGDLRTANVKVWIDQLDIKAGVTWDVAVEAALQSCSGLLVILSPGAVSSRSVMDEVSFALDENKKVIPVLYRAGEIPFRLRRLQRIDFISNYSAGLSKLVAALNGAQPSLREGDAEREYDRETEPPPPVRRSRLVTALCAGLAGAILAAASGFLMYAHDARMVLHLDSLLLMTLFGGLVAGLLWGVAGAIAGSRALPLLLAVGTSLVVLALWIGIFGTYNDVMWAAVIFGWPVGGIVGATIGVVISKVRGGGR